MKTFLLLASILLFTACSTPPKPAEQVNNLADRYVEAYFTAFPELAAMVGAPDLHPEKLSDRSFTALQQWYTTENKLLDELNAIDRNALKGMPEIILTRSCLLLH